MRDSSSYVSPATQAFRIRMDLNTVPWHAGDYQTKNAEAGLAALYLPGINRPNMQSSWGGMKS